IESKHWNLITGPCGIGVRVPTRTIFIVGRMAIERSRIRWNGWGWAAHRDALGSREEVWSWLARQLGMPSLLATPSQRLEGGPLSPARLGAPGPAHILPPLW